MKKWLLLFFCIAALKASSQTLFNVDADSLRFEYFVNLIESHSDYFFYYDTSQTNKLSVTIHAKSQPIEKILSAIFINTDFHFAIDNDNHIFITNSFAIQTALPQDFLNMQTAKIDTASSLPQMELTGSTITKEKVKLAVENKLFEIGNKADEGAQSKATISGYVRDAKSGEPIIGATILSQEQNSGVTTDQYGYYSLTLPKGRHVLKIMSLGMTDTRRQVIVYSNGNLNIEMSEFIPTLKDVVVSADKTVNVKSAMMGAQQLNIKTIKQIPSVFGEADVLRAILTLPGVTSVGESSTGFNVRGGSADQNLILFNDATVYNPSHFFGFFSAFNPDVIKTAELYKSSIPEKYGGRLSSVLDVTAREGNKKKFEGSGGIGPITSRVSFEGPIDSGRTSFIVSARTTYSDWLLRSIHNNTYGNSTAGFTDANLLISHEINANNNIYVSAYISNDRFRLNSDTTYTYSNRNANIKWKHLFNNKISGVFTAGVDHYQFGIASTVNPVNAYKFDFNIDQIYGRADFDYAINTKHDVDFGITTVHYKLQPGSFVPNSSQSLVVKNTVETEQALESAIYAGDHINVSQKFSVNAGVRLSVFNYLGPHTVYNYAPGLPREESTLQDSSTYSNGAVIKTYLEPEVRLTARYSLTENASLKFSYNTQAQYIHTLSNTTAISPTDIFKLSDTHIQPQTGDQYSIGYYHNFKQNTIETSIEIYYRNMYHYLDYKSGATLVLNHHIETDVLNAKGRAYGAELLIRKTEGKLNGWLSYTYSRIQLKTDDPLAEKPVNNGDWYPADYDKPNVVNFIGNYRINHRFSLSLNVVYSTGRPITLPIAEYYYANSYRVLYSNRNEYRIPDYFRSDFSMNLDGNYKIHQRVHNSWTFGVYNFTARKNPYSVFFQSQNGHVQGYKLSIFGTAIPFITFNFKF
ncbi:MAG TPA: TonB-dependent receptor [Parafilimonas sp.]|nr:TonB-dependent receptor [Parafilimonas sp.]